MKLLNNVNQFSLNLLTVFALSTAAALPLASAHSAYPQYPINMVVSYGPGGGTDLVARAIAPYIEKYLGDGARIVVQNRPGAGGAIGFAEIARAKADGYTVGFLNTPNLVTIPIERKTHYHWTDFDLLGNLIDDADSFAVHANSPIKTLKDLAEYARANPGKVTVGTTGVGSDDHLAMLLFQRMANVDMLHVPYKGASEVRTALVGGEITMAAMNIGEVMAYVQGGTPMHDLGVMGEERADLAPEIPTFKEQGYDVIMSSLRGLGAPKGLPVEIKERLVAAIEKAANDPEFLEQAKRLYVPMRYLGPDDYAEELADTENMFKQFWSETPWAEQ